MDINDFFFVERNGRKHRVTKFFCDLKMLQAKKKKNELCKQKKLFISKLGSHILFDELTGKYRHSKGTKRQKHKTMDKAQNYTKNVLWKKDEGTDRKVMPRK